MAGLTQGWAELRAAAREFFRRHWRDLLPIRDWMRLSEETFHLLLAGVIGVIGGLTNLGYHWCSRLVQFLMLAGTGDLPDIAEQLEPWQRLMIPTVGALAAGPVLPVGLRLIGHLGLGNLLEGVVAGDGRLPLRVGLVNGVSSMVSISTGASIGREGLIIQLAATLASKLGQLANWPPYRSEEHTSELQS